VMTKPTCPMCGAELHKDGVWWFCSDDICLLYDTALSEEDLSRVAERQARAVAEAVEPWMQGVRDLSYILEGAVDLARKAGRPMLKAERIITRARALLAREEQP